MGKQGFKDFGGNPYIYQESVISSAIGLDNLDNKFKIEVEPAAGATPIGAQFTIDPSINGNITIEPNGIGNVIISTGLIVSNSDIEAAAGDVKIDFGDLILTSGKLTVAGVSGNDGQILIAKTANSAKWASLTSSHGTVTITESANALNIDVSSTWTEVAAASVNLVARHNYIMNRATLITATLPILASKGTIIRLTGMGVGGWKIAQNVGQIVYFGTLATTPGIGGTLSSTADRDSIELVCVVENTDFNVLSSIGNILIV